jgi:hypothetical protein
MYTTMVIHDDVPLDAQLAFFDALRTAYVQSFDTLCCSGGSDPGGRYFDDTPLDIAVYMLWDISELASWRASISQPDLSHACDRAVVGALQCRTSTCVMSGLHAVGHMAPHIRTAFRRHVDEAMSGQNLPQWVQDYAERAHEGHVQ